MNYRKKPEPRPLLLQTIWMKPGDLPNVLQETWPQLVFSKDRRHFWLRIAGHEAREWMPTGVEFIDSQWDNVVVPFDSTLHTEEEGTRVDIKNQLDPTSSIFKLVIKHLEYWGLNLREADIHLTYLQPWATTGSAWVLPGQIILTDVETGAVADVLVDNEELIAKYERQPFPDAAAEAGNSADPA